MSIAEVLHHANIYLTPNNAGHHQQRQLTRGVAINPPAQQHKHTTTMLVLLPEV
jgi:hypothetical protein